MYAAAGGASLASRQARQRQRQEKKNKQLQAKLHPPKAAGIGVGLGAADHGGASTPTRSQSRQFHQLPTSYLRAPQPQGRKLSATYTQSRSLLPIEEAGSDTQSVLQLRMHSHGHGHAHTPGTLAGHGHSHLHHSHMHHGGPPQTPYQQFASSHGRVSPKLVHRHSGSGSSAGFPLVSAAGAYPASSPGGQLHKSATATLPLVSQMEPTPPTTPSALPSAAVGVKTTVTSLETAHASTSAAAAAAAAAEAELQLVGAAAMFAATHHDAIIVTPATPMASPGHAAAAAAAAIKLRRGLADEEDDDELAEAAERQPLTSYDDEDEAMQPPSGPLERKCSVYRMRRSDGFADATGSGGVGGAGGLKRQLRELQFQQTQYEPLVSDEPQLLFKGLGNGRKWQLCAYCEEGICVCEHLEKNTYVTTPPAPQPEPPPPPPECAQGRAAWLERGRRCSVQEQQQQQATCHRRWVKRNRIQDASLGGSSDDEDFLGVLRGPSTFANAFLYVGLGTVALGLVIAFVGTGEKGFKTVELRLIGPSLIVLGLICCILRILFCICPSHCISSSKKTRKKNGNKIDADHTTSLLRNESKRVSIARGPAMQPKYPIAHKRSQSKMLNEGMEALRQIATTSLFMQNEQKTAINRVVPIINEPESMDHMAADEPLEMKKLQTALNLCEMSDEEREEEEGVASQQPLQLAKRTTATTTTAVTSSTTKATTTTTTATTTLSTVDEKPNRSSSSSSSSKLQRQRVALQQQRQQQQQQQQQQQLPEQSQSLSSSSTVRDSLDGVVVEETSLIDAELAAPLPSSCSTGAIPRLKSMPPQRPGISTGATPKTTPTTNTNTGSTGTTRLTSSQSHPTSYDLPPAQPHTYSAATTVRGPLGMTLTGSSSVYAMPASRPSAAATPSTTTISLLPLPAPPAKPTAASVTASIPGQVPETAATSSSSAYSAFASHSSSSSAASGMATTSLSILQPASLLASTSASTSLQRPATAAASFTASPSATATASTSIFGSDHKSQPSSAGAMGRGSSSLLLPPPTKFEPELVLSPAKLGQ